MSRFDDMQAEQDGAAEVRQVIAREARQRALLSTLARYPCPLCGEALTLGADLASFEDYPQRIMHADCLTSWGCDEARAELERCDV